MTVSIIIIIVTEADQACSIRSLVHLMHVPVADTNQRQRSNS